MLSNLLQPGKKGNLTKRTAVYISDILKQVIIAPQSINNAGIIYGQDTCFTRDLPIEGSILGSEIIKSLDLFSKKDTNLREKKMTDWPAFRHSKCKSVLTFERDYIFLSILSENNSNLILDIEGYPSKESDLCVKSTISFQADHREIGEKVLKVYNACLTGKIF